MRFSAQRSNSIKQLCERVNQEVGPFLAVKIRTMTPLPAKVTAIGKQGQQYRAVVQIRSKYRGSVTTLVFGELKPHSGFLKEGRLDLVYCQNPGLNAGDPFPLWTLH
jgi:hypothetical protein